MAKFYVDFVAHRGYVIEAENEDEAIETAEYLNDQGHQYTQWEVEDVEDAPDDAEPDNIQEYDRT